MLPNFDLVEPRSLDEALDALADHGGVPIAGGTNVLVDLRGGRDTAGRLVDIARLEELKGIAREDGWVRLGAGTTLSRVLRDPLIAEEAPSLAAAARVFGGAMVRNTATVAGNLCYGSPAGDLIPPLMALDAEVVLRSARGERALPLAEFFTGVRQTARRRDELMTTIRWPARRQRSAQAFYKLGLRKGDAVAVVAIGVALTAENGKCGEARIALGAVAPVVLRAEAAESVLSGQQLSAAVIDEAARRAVDACTPIDDIRATAEYRRHAVGALTRRLVSQAWQAID